MRLHLLAVPAFAGALLFACSSGDGAVTSNGASDGDGGGNASADGSTASKDDASMLAEDASTSSDSSSTSDAQQDSGVLPSSKPPAGTTLCKKGTFTAADVKNACNQPVSFGPAPVNECDAVTSNGGKYEVWCGAGNTYVWAEVDDLAPKKNECPVGNGNFSLSPSANYTFSAGAVGAGGASLKSTGSNPYLIGTSRSFVLEATFGATDTHGSFTIWATGIDTTCLLDGSFYDALVAGVSGSW